LKKIPNRNTQNQKTGIRGRKTSVGGKNDGSGKGVREYGKTMDRRGAEKRKKGERIRCISVPAGKNRGDIERKRRKKKKLEDQTRR